MGVLRLLDHGKKEISNPAEIKKFMNERGIIFEQWEASQPLKDSDSQETILKAYEHELAPYMKKNGYVNADVINVHKDTPNIEAIRAKFLSEHTHAEDEVRFFVDGEGEFFFHLKDRGEVFSLLCQKGDFISVPKGYTHWFDLAPKYHVKAIRVFMTPEGWVANYTNSGVEKEISVMSRKLFLFDIEGTTTDINFVHKVLFPYSRERMSEFVTKNEKTLAPHIAEVKKTITEEDGKETDLKSVIYYLIKWIDEDRKHKALKEIQGLIWEEGYRNGAFKGHVYQDVRPFFENLHSSGYLIGIYSSGSVHAQKLILANSSAGDLTPFIKYYFDTQVGQKREKVSYQNIAIKTQLPPPEIHFFSDIPEELKAAELAGFRVSHVIREGTQPSSFHGIKNFAEFRF